MTVSENHLKQIYAHSVDPWNFRTSPYERNKFELTRTSLSRPRYECALELGCGNGELARRLSPVCGRYVGVDAVEEALEEARRSVPDGEFFRGFLPCTLPEGNYGLIILSEILYFLDPDGIARLAGQIERRWPLAELLCVSYLGTTGNLLSGEESLACFTAALGPFRRFRPLVVTPHFRIDRSVSRTRPEPGNVH